MARIPHGFRQDGLTLGRKARRFHARNASRGKTMVNGFRPEHGTETTGAGRGE